jgi:hypothetical protein
MATRTLALACLLVLAGCTTPLDPTAGTPTAMPADAPESTAGTTPTAEAATPTDRPPSANPWGSDPIVVAVRNEGSRDRDFAALVREATTFWEAGSQYLGFGVEYEVRPDAEDPDLIVAFADRVPDCGNVADAAGCAPLLTDPRQVDRPETAWVKTGLSDESTVLVTEHELGHTLGLTHDDPPRDVMRARSVLYTEPQPNATERAFPWADADFTVRVDAANDSDPAGARSQVDHALTYYEGDPPGMPTNLTFERTDADAELLIRFGATDACRASSGSCIGTYGTDPDGDGAIETYTRVEITLVGLDTEAVGWHVGYWLAHAFGAEADAEKPPPFRDASGRERRSAWWA